MKLYVKIALGVVLFIALAGILAALYMFNLKHTDTSRAKPDFVISATDLQKAFENDEAAASKKYINKIIEVTGKIASVKSGENNIVSVSLITGNEMSAVICTFPSIKTTKLAEAGNEITLRGECSGFLLDVLLNNCALIQNKK